MLNIILKAGNGKQFHLWWLVRYLKIVLQFQIGRGVWSPVTVEVNKGWWDSPGGPQSLRPPWDESRWMRRWAIAKPPPPSSWVKTNSTCLCSGGIASTVSRAPRVETTLKLSWQSQRTCSHLSAWRFSTVTTNPACQIENGFYNICMLTCADVNLPNPEWDNKQSYPLSPRTKNKQKQNKKVMKLSIKKLKRKIYRNLVALALGHCETNEPISQNKWRRCDMFDEESLAAV